VGRSRLRCSVAAATFSASASDPLATSSTCYLDRTIATAAIFAIVSTYATFTAANIIPATTFIAAHNVTMAITITITIAAHIPTFTDATSISIVTAPRATARHQHQ
jgi:hypothetical protein